MQKSQETNSDSRLLPPGEEESQDNESAVSFRYRIADGWRRRRPEKTSIAVDGGSAAWSVVRWSFRFIMAE